MQTRQIDAPAELQRSLDLLVKHWQLAIPTAVASLAFSVFVVFVVLAALAGLAGAAVISGGADGLGRATGVMVGLLTSASFLIGLPLLLLTLVLANVMTIAAAEDAWQGQSPDFRGAFNRALSKLPILIVAFILIALLAIVPTILVAAFGLGVLLLMILGFFMMYVTPAIVLGNASGSGAIGESYRLVRANLGPSAWAFVAIIVVTFVGQLLNSLVQHIPLVNFVSAFVVGGLTAAYTALVSARFYDVLRGKSEAYMPPAAPPPSTFITPAQ